MESDAPRLKDLTVLIIAPTDAMLTIAPPPSDMDAFQTAWLQSRGPVWLTATVFAARDGSIPASGPL
jgi:hypothetical protein